MDRSSVIEFKKYCSIFFFHISKINMFDILYLAEMSNYSQPNKQLQKYNFRFQKAKKMHQNHTQIMSIQKVILISTSFQHNLSATKVISYISCDISNTYLLVFYFPYLEYFLVINQFFIKQKMKFFCVKTTPVTNKLVFQDMVKVILQTSPQFRVDSDHNKVFSYFHDDIYLNTIDKSRSIARFLLCVTILQGLRIQGDQDITSQIKNIQYLVVMEGKLKSNDIYYETKSNISKKQLQKIDKLKTGKNGCFIAYLTKERYQQLLQYSLDQIKKKVDDLKQFNLFKDFTQTHLLYLSSTVISETYRFRQKVYNFGEESTYVYCILKGSFEVVRRFKLQSTRYESNISYIQDGQTFGQDCIFLNCNRETEIRSLVCDNIVYKIPAQCILQVYDQYPKLKDQLVVNIIQRRSIIQKKCHQNATLLENSQTLAKMKNASFHTETVVFPKIQEKLYKRQKLNLKMIKQKSNQQMGLELLAKAFNLNQYKLLTIQKPAVKNSKKDLLRSLGASYLISKLSQSKQDDLLGDKSRSYCQVSSQMRGNKQNCYQFPLIMSVNSQIRNSKHLQKKTKCKNKKAKRNIIGKELYP